ncbi:MAG: InlB B-repeat-containing protein [Clostridia bacterium]|nr:InlB B-repeat-containing protein [Clostridia bacterium]
MKTRLHRLLAWLLTAALLITLLPASALAEGWGSVQSNVTSGQQYYVVTFQTEDGVLLRELVRGEGLTLPEAPARAGYEFLRWEAEGEAVAAGMQVDHDMTVTAVYRRIGLVDVEIRYVYDVDGAQNAFSRHKATLAASDLTAGAYEVRSPEYVEVGGEAYWPDRTVVSVTAEDLDFVLAQGGDQLLITVTYAPADIAYTLVTLVGSAEEDRWETLSRASAAGRKGASVEPPVSAGYGELVRLENEVLLQNGQEVRAYYERSAYTLSFDAAGGTAIPSVTGGYGEAVDAGAYVPVRTGYAFVGWQDEEGNEISGTVLLTRDITLRAVWTEAETGYTVVYYREAFQGDETVYEYAESVSGVALTGAVIRADEALVPEDRYPYYEPDEERNLGAETVVLADGSATLPVYYRLKAYELRFDFAAEDALLTSDGESLDAWSMTVRLGEDIAARWPTADEMNRPGYLFRGWTNGGATYVTKRDVVTSQLLPATGETVTYTAMWTQDEAAAQVNYWLQDATGSYVRSEALSQTVSTSSALSAKEIRGFTHQPALDRHEGSVYDFYYDRSRYVFEYYDGGALLGVSEPVLFEADVSVGFDLIPEKADAYRFDGWYADPALTTPYSFSFMPDHHVALYAGWQDPAVTFVTDDGASRQAVSYGQAVGRPSAPAKAYHTFVGWYTAPENGERYDFSRPVTEDVTLYAVFRPNEIVYTVRYLAAETGEALLPERRIVDSSLAAGTAITEQAKLIAGMVPSAAQASLTLSPEEDENVLTFYYSPAPETLRYAVYYRHAETGAQVLPPAERVVSGDTAVVQELAPDAEGLYPAQAVQALTLSGGVNELIFYYHEYQTSAVTVYLLDMDGEPLPGRDAQTTALRLAESFDARLPVSGYTFDHTEGPEIYSVREDSVGETVTVKAYYRKDLTLAPRDLEKTYDGAPLQNDGPNDALATGLREGHSLTLVSFTGSQTEVGSSASGIVDYQIGGTPSGNDYYAITLESGLLTVLPVPVQPTTAPTAAPTVTPTVAPTATPTASPTPVPTAEPTAAPAKARVKAAAPRKAAAAVSAPVTLEGLNVDIPSGHTLELEDDVYRVYRIKDASGNVIGSFTYDESAKRLTITDGSVTLSGETDVSVLVTGNANVTLAGVTITPAKNSPAIKIDPTATCVLTLAEGTENNLTGKGQYAALAVGWASGEQFADLTINGEGTLNATATGIGAGIGGSKSEQGVYGNITIESGIINATGAGRSAGIGSSDNPNDGASHGSYKYSEEKWGTITINGGTITAVGVGNGAGIGGGNHTDSGIIIINDGTINAKGDSGIGSGLGSSGGSDKGPGYYSAYVTINGGNVTAFATNNMGAGIGGGMYSDAYVTITGGTINASVSLSGNAYQGGAGIGGGYQGVGVVVITGGTVTATG